MAPDAVGWMEGRAISGPIEFKDARRTMLHVFPDLTVTVEDERIVQIRGSRANPYTGGVICTKVAGDHADFVHGDRRLTTPLRRAGAKGEGRFEPLTWDAALDLIHARVSAVVRAHGPQAVLPLNYAGPHGMLAYASMDLRFFHRLGATLLDRKPLCGGVRTEAWLGTYGPVPGMRPEQAAQAKLVIAWGNNVTYCNLHFTSVMHDARRNGAKLVVVDPRRTKIAEQADLHVALRPGTDVILAWAVTAMQGVTRPRTASMARISAIISKPSTSGIARSLTSTSAGRSRHWAIASAPPVAVRTVAPALSSTSESNCSASG